MNPCLSKHRTNINLQTILSNHILYISFDVNFFTSISILTYFIYLTTFLLLQFKPLFFLLIPNRIQSIFLFKDKFTSHFHWKFLFNALTIEIFFYTVQHCRIDLIIIANQFWLKINFNSIVCPVHEQSFIMIVLISGGFIQQYCYSSLEYSIFLQIFLTQFP